MLTTELATVKSLKADVSSVNPSSDEVKFLQWKKKGKKVSRTQITINWVRFVRNELQSFRLPSVRLRLESIRPRPICQFAYILNSLLWQSLYETVDSIETKINDIRKLSQENLISQLMNSNDYYVDCVHLIVLWNER